MNVDALIQEQSNFVKSMGLDPTKQESWDLAFKVVEKTRKNVLEAVAAQGLGGAN